MSGRQKLSLLVIVMTFWGGSPITAQDDVTLAAIAPTPRPDVVGAASEDPVEAIAAVGPVTGFPIPRFVSIKASEANARRGPGRAYQIDWVFTRRGQPVQIVAEHGHWRRVVDRDGEGGWMHYSLLSGSRTGIVEVDMLAIRQRPDMAAPIRARAELGVVAEIDECRADWCRIRVGGYRGWVLAGTLWGVEPGEVFE